MSSMPASVAATRSIICFGMHVHKDSISIADLTVTDRVKFPTSRSSEIPYRHPRQDRMTEAAVEQSRGST